MAENALVRHTRIRKAVQGIWGILHNAHVQGFLTGTIYEGPLKKFCVPGMNCYSCPGAVGACPIGSMQAVFDARKRKFSFYVVGYLALIGLLVGRFICGWLCLFGLIQELLYKIPTPKLKIPEKTDKVLRYLKYVMLLVFVFGLFLQIHLSGRDTGRRDPACPAEQRNAGRCRCAFPVEILSAGPVHPRICFHLPPVLQICLPAGSLLRHVPEGQRSAPEPGRGSVHPLRRMCAPVQNGR